MGRHYNIRNIQKGSSMNLLHLWIYNINSEKSFNKKIRLLDVHETLKSDTIINYCNLNSA